MRNPLQTHMHTRTDTYTYSRVKFSNYLARAYILNFMFPVAICCLAWFVLGVKNQVLFTLVIPGQQGLEDYMLKGDSIKTSASGFQGKVTEERAERSSQGIFWG